MGFFAEAIQTIASQHYTRSPSAVTGGAFAPARIGPGAENEGKPTGDTRFTLAASPARADRAPGATHYARSHHASSRVLL